MDERLKKLNELAEEKFKRRINDSSHIRSMKFQRVAYEEGIYDTLIQVDKKLAEEWKNGK